MRTAIVLALSLFSHQALGQNAAAKAAATLDELMPRNTVPAEVYQWTNSSARWERVAQAVSAAAAKDPAWFMQQARDSSGPIPYDKRFQVSRQDYEAYLEAGSDVLALSKFARASLVVESRDEAIVLRLANSVVMDMGLYLDRATGELTISQIGSTPPPAPVEARLKALSGDYRGLIWKVAEQGETFARDGEVVVAKLSGEPGVCALMASFSKLVNGKFVIRERFVVKYPCPVKRKS